MMKPFPLYNSRMVPIKKEVQESVRDKKRLQCPECNYTCTYSSQLWRHAVVHQTDRPFKCNLCDYASKSKRGLRKHGKIHNKSKPYCCNLCDFTSKRHCSISRHMRKHSMIEQRRIKLEFEACNFKSAQNNKIQMHLRDVHMKEQRTYKCSVCEYAPLKRANLNRHIKRKHPECLYDAETLKCEFCNFKTFDKPALMRHKLLRHFHNVNDNISKNEAFKKPQIQKAQNVLNVPKKSKRRIRALESQDAVLKDMKFLHVPKLIWEKSSKEADCELKVLYKCKHCDYVGEDQLVAIHNEDAHSVPFVVLKMFPKAH